jgi:hypothetical protein
MVTVAFQLNLLKLQLLVAAVEMADSEVEMVEVTDRVVVTAHTVEVAAVTEISFLLHF